MKGKTILFLHIPKNSGSSIRKIISRFYDRSELYIFYTRRMEDGIQIHDIDDFYALSNEEKSRIKLFCGHFSFGLHHQIPRPCSYVTFLRDPYERMISLFYYVSIEGYDHRYLPKIKSEKMSLSDFIRSGIAEEADNHQTRCLSGVKADYGKCTRDMLELAKSNLREYFAVVGLSERFRESVLLMKKALGWKYPFWSSLKDRLLNRPDPFYEKVNITPDRPNREKLSPDEIKAIEEFNSLDIELYKYGEELFRKQLKDYGIRLVQRSHVR